jgi:hypothetical protein
MNAAAGGAIGAGAAYEIQANTVKTIDNAAPAEVRREVGLNGFDGGGGDRGRRHEGVTFIVTRVRLGDRAEMGISRGGECCTTTVFAWVVDTNRCTP